MPLSPPVNRTSLHQRSITCNGYERDDGLWDIEAHMIDTRGYDIELETAPKLPAGQPLHEMWLRVTIDDLATIKMVDIAFGATPFKVCGGVAERYQQLVGLQIGPGWRKRLRGLVTGTLGCTHMTELLGPIATVTFQTLAPVLSKRNKQSNAVNTKSRPPHIDTCHALRANGSVVKEYYPQWFDNNK